INSTHAVDVKIQAVFAASIESHSPYHAFVAAILFFGFRRGYDFKNVRWDRSRRGLPAAIRENV
ncbi:MAG: hypothetical protein VW709_20470, partial [Rickettsiales bacterium]